MNPIFFDVEFLIILDPIDIHSLECVSTESKKNISVIYNNQYLWKNKCSISFNINSDMKLDWRMVYKLVTRHGIIGLILNENSDLVALAIQLKTSLDNPILYFSIMFLKGWTDSMGVLLKYNQISLSEIGKYKEFSHTGDLKWVDMFSDIEYVEGIEWLLLGHEPVFAKLNGWGRDKSSPSTIGSLKSMKFILDNMDNYKLNLNILYIIATAAAIFEFFDMLVLFNEKFPKTGHQNVIQYNRTKESIMKEKNKRRNIPDIDI
jgi:hypothetical protein